MDADDAPPPVDVIADRKRLPRGIEQYHRWNRIYRLLCSGGFGPRTTGLGVAQISSYISTIKKTQVVKVFSLVPRIFENCRLTKSSLMPSDHIPFPVKHRASCDHIPSSPRSARGTITTEARTSGTRDQQGGATRTAARTHRRDQQGGAMRTVAR
jgi:hypothetical protein